MPGPSGSSISTTIQIGSGFSALSNTIVNGGKLLISNGGYANLTNINSGGSVVLGNDGKTTSTTINSNGFLDVSSGGIALSTFVNSGGAVQIRSGGVINSAAVSSGGAMNVAGGSATDVYIHESAVLNANVGAQFSNLNAASGAVVNGFTIQQYNSKMEDFHFSGAIVGKYGTTSAYLYKGQIAEDIKILGNNYNDVYISGGTAINTIVERSNKYAELRVYSGGLASNTSVYGSMYISRASASDTIIYSGGIASGYYSATFSNTTLSGGTFTVYSATAVENTISGGRMNLLYGVATSNVVENGILSNCGGILSKTTLNNGTIIVSDYWGGDASAVSTTLNGGTMNVNGAILYTTLSSGATLNLNGGTEYLTAYEGAIINGIRLDADQATWSSGVHISSATLIADAGYARNGFDIDTLLITGGTLTVTSGGNAGNITVENETVLNIEAGGRLYGHMNFSENTTVNVAGGDKAAIIDFTVSEHKADGSALVNDYSRFNLTTGFPKYTITVSEKQEEGIYVLANKAQDYSEAATLIVGMSQQTLTCNGDPLEFNHRIYQLKNQDGILSLNLTISDYPPTTPGNPDQTVNGRSVTMTWDASTDDKGVSGYYFRYGTTEDLSPEKTITITDTSYQMKNMNVGTYYWQVQAFDTENQVSDWTEVQSFTIEPDDPPTTPLNLQQTVDAENNVFFTWDASTDDKGVSGYYFRYGTTPDLSGETSITVTDPSYQLANMDVGTYYWQVQAFDTVKQESDWSAVQSFTILPDAPPSKPTNLTCTVTDQTASFTWTASEDEHGVAGYTFVYGTSSDRTKGISFTVEENAFQLTGLANGTYYWWVQAFDTSEQTSQWVKGKNFTINYTPPDTPPTTPDGLISEVYKKNVAFTWNPSQDVEGVSGYYFRYGTTPDLSSETTVTLTTTSYEILNLKNNVYYWQVQAFDTASQTSDWSTVESFTIDYVDYPPTTPTNLSQEVDGRAVSFTWDPSEDDEGVVSYRLRYGLTTDPSSAKTITVKDTSYSIERLEGGKYYWQVQAVDTADQTSDWTWEQSFTIVDNPPSTPTGLGQIIDGLTVTFTWNKAIDDYGISGYELRYGTSSDLTPEEIITVEGTSYSPGKLTGGDYYWQVRAIDDADQPSVWSGVQAFTIAADTPPTTPLNQKQTVKNDSAKLTWDPSFDDYGVTGYVLRYSTDEKMSSATEIALDASCGYVLNNLKNGRWYWQVKAVDREDQSSEWSDVSSFVVSYSEDLPDAPQGSYVTASKKKSTLSWTPFTQAQAQRIFYDVLVNQYSAKKPVKVTYQVIVDGGAIIDCKKNELPLNDYAIGKHTFELRAVISQNGSAPVYTNWSTFDAVVPDAEPPKTGKLYVEQTDTNSLLVNWAPAEDNTGISCYLVACGLEKKIVQSSILSTEFDGVYSSKATVYLTAYDTYGNAGNTVKKTVTMKDMTPPDQVTGLKASKNFNNKTGGMLTWDAGHDNVGVTQYLISIEGVNKTYKSKTNAINIKGLTVAGNYKYTVVAVDKAKNQSIVSEECEFAVKDVIAPKIKKLSSKVTDDSALITWDAWDETSISSMELVLDHQTSYDVTNQTSLQLDGLLLGAHSVDLRVLDGGFNMTTKSIMLKVKSSTNMALLASAI